MSAALILSEVFCVVEIQRRHGAFGPTAKGPSEVGSIIVYRFQDHERCVPRSVPPFHPAGGVSVSALSRLVMEMLTQYLTDSEFSPCGGG